jgi:hypothetical protein
MQRTGTPVTDIDQDETWIEGNDDHDMAGGLATPDTCYGSEDVLSIGSPVNGPIVSYISPTWRPAHICADIQVPSTDIYDDEILILDKFLQRTKLPLKPQIKYAFVLGNGVMLLYIAHRKLRVTVQTYISDRDITGGGGIILSAVIALCRLEQHSLRIPDDELTFLKRTMDGVCESYCQWLAKPERALAFSQDAFVHRQRSFCGLHLRTLSRGQSNIRGISKLFHVDSIFPIRGELGPAMIKDNEIHVTLCWKGREPIVVQIREDIAELNHRGCFFVEEGIVPAGQIEKLSNCSCVGCG